jgi:hypothetical protein
MSTFELLKVLKLGTGPQTIVVRGKSRGNRLLDGEACIIDTMMLQLYSEELPPDEDEKNEDDPTNRCILSNHGIPIDLPRCSSVLFGLGAK